MTIHDDGSIASLALGEIIVVGSNKDGLHGGGAAAYAHRYFGLVWGCGEGLSGQTYALPTMEGIKSFRMAIERFKEFARNHTNIKFYLTRVGCGIAGYRDNQISPLFKDSPSNVVKPENWCGSLTSHRPSWLDPNGVGDPDKNQQPSKEES